MTQVFASGTVPLVINDDDFKRIVQSSSGLVAGIGLS
jgi:hypothetical protein